MRSANAKRILQIFSTRLPRPGRAALSMGSPVENRPGSRGSLAFLSRATPTMRSATATLRAEHALLREALDALAAVADHVAQGGAFPAADCALLLRFFRDFVGAVHCRKEAEVVLPALAVHGSDAQAELAGELLAAQEEAAHLLHALILFWEPHGNLTPEERASFVQTAGHYRARLLRTADLEDRELLPCVDQVVPADDRLDWGSSFDALEAVGPDAAHWRAQLDPVLSHWR